MNLIISIILTLTAIFAPVQASEPTSAPVAEAPTFSLAPFKLAPLWAIESLASAGVETPANVTFLFQNEDNCGAEISQAGLGGCTVPMANGHYAVLVSPELAYTAWGNHILFHELAHTMGANECEAEAYAHQFETVLLWSYPQCEAA